MGKNMGESAGKELFPRRKPGTRLFAYYGQKTTEENRVKAHSSSVSLTAKPVFPPKQSGR
jgi:hypothetical protein